MPQGFGFEIERRHDSARTGRLLTTHGVVRTPAFVPVATYGAVRGLAPDELQALGAQMLLANTYHLHERPGEALIQQLGGLHGFTGWRGPWLTDSGGFQVTSLAARLRIDEDGVTFASPVDGRRRQLTPESAVRIQEALGSDVAMVLDECQPHGDALRVQAATERTLRWAERSVRARRRPDQALFGIVQGGTSLAARRRHARQIAELGFDGFAHGGLGLGEERGLRRDLIDAAGRELPPAAPRYLMGLGRPLDLLDAIAAGIDLFDCVVPTRHARHGVLFTSQGMLRIKTRRFRDDAGPPDPDCDCATCARHSRAYLRHLLRLGEALGARLASLHNLHFYSRLLSDARRGIETGELAALRGRVEAWSGEA